MNEEQKYHIDCKPASFKDVIRKAREYGYDGEVLQSSVAAKILREHGHKVGNINEIPPNETIKSKYEKRTNIK